MDNRYIAAIDVGTSTIKAFIGNRMADGTIFIAGHGTMPTLGITKGIITDVKVLATVIHQAIECAVMATQISVKEVYLGLSGIEMKSITGIGSIAPTATDGISDDDITRVYQAAVLTNVPDHHEVLHVLPIRFLVDENEQIPLPLHQKCTHLEVEAHIVYIPKNIIDELIVEMKTIGIHIMGIIGNHIVTTQMLDNQGTQNYVLMDIGAATTELVFVANNKIQLSTALPLGGDYITRDIMNGFEISYQHAEEIKKYYSKLGKNLRGQNIILDCNGYGTVDKHFSYDFLYDIVESRIEEIVYLIHEYLKSTTEISKIEKIILTGGCGSMPNIGDRVGELFGTPVEEVKLQNLLPEYATHANFACYGVLTYAVNHMINAPVVMKNNNAWRALLGKFKNLLNS